MLGGEGEGKRGGGRGRRRGQRESIKTYNVEYKCTLCMYVHRPLVRGGGEAKWTLTQVLLNPPSSLPLFLPLPPSPSPSLSLPPSPSPSLSLPLSPSLPPSLPLPPSPSPSLPSSLPPSPLAVSLLVLMILAAKVCFVLAWMTFFTILNAPLGGGGEWR